MKSNLNKMALNAKARPRNLIMSKGKTLKQMYGLFDHGKQKNIILKDSMKKIIHPDRRTATSFQVVAAPGRTLNV
jgi:hypothetical protein